MRKSPQQTTLPNNHKLKSNKNLPREEIRSTETPSDKRNTSPKPQSPVKGRDMLIQNQTPQRATSTPKSSPNNSFLREEPSFSCAWCHYNKKPHDHTTEECYFIKDADALDQWRAIYFNRVCNKCLSQGHIWKDCTLTSPPCNVCNLNHHVNLKCRPIERISRYPFSNAQ